MTNRRLPRQPDLSAIIRALLWVYKLAMPPPTAIQYEGAIYHLMSRGDRREEIFCDDLDRKDFLEDLRDCLP